MRLLTAAALLLPSAALAQVPSAIGYQGRLTKADGTPAAGVLSFKFSMFDAPTAGDALWCETQDVVVTNGDYAVFLGQGTAAGCTGTLQGAFAGADRYLEIAVQGLTLSPRQQIGSVPYAIAAGVALRIPAGSSDYIQNQSAAAQNATFNIAGGAKLGGDLSIAAQTAKARLHAAGGASIAGTGTLSTITGAASVTGSGTSFSSQLAPGDEVIVGPQSRVVTAVASDTSLSVDAPFSPALTSSTYALRKPIARLDDSAGSTQLVANSRGDVGIGNLTPQAKLDVAGTIKATGSDLGLSYGRFEGPGAATQLGSDMYIPLATSPVNSGGLTLSGNMVTVAKAGYYRIGAHLSFDLSDTNKTVTFLFLTVNDNKTAGIRIGEVYTKDSRQDTGYISGDTIVQLNAGDRVGAWAANNGIPQLVIYYCRLTIQQLP